MKLKFKMQRYQTDEVEQTVNVFAGDTLSGDGWEDLFDGIFPYEE